MESDQECLIKINAKKNIKKGAPKYQNMLTRMVGRIK